MSDTLAAIGLGGEPPVEDQFQDSALYGLLGAGIQGAAVWLGVQRGWDPRLTIWASQGAAGAANLFLQHMAFAAGEPITGFEVVAAVVVSIISAKATAALFAALPEMQVGHRTPLVRGDAERERAFDEMVKIGLSSFAVFAVFGFWARRYFVYH